MSWVLALRSPRRDMNGRRVGSVTFLFLEGDRLVPAGMARDVGEPLRFPSRDAAERKAIELRASVKRWIGPHEFTVEPVEEIPWERGGPKSHNDFKNPGLRARRIDSRETFHTKLVFPKAFMTRGDCAILADPNCPICLSSGAIEGVEPRICDCCFREDR